MSLNPRHLFLVDCIGAIVTASLLVVVLAPYQSTFGMPSRVVYVLAVIAAGLAVYSATCYLTRPANWTVFLRGIAIANLSYSALTAILLYVYHSDVTPFGAAYFAGEMLVVFALAIYELITARRAAGQ